VPALAIPLITTLGTLSPRQQPQTVCGVCALKSRNRNSRLGKTIARRQRDGQRRELMRDGGGQTSGPCHRYKMTSRNPRRMLSRPCPSAVGPIIIGSWRPLPSSHRVLAGFVHSLFSRQILTFLV
jgi:hypothetical protein